jgi:hypothetical protein
MTSLSTGELLTDGEWRQYGDANAEFFRSEEERIFSEIDRQRVVAEAEVRTVFEREIRRLLPDSHLTEARMQEYNSSFKKGRVPVPLFMMLHKGDEQSRRALKHIQYLDRQTGRQKEKELLANLRRIQKAVGILQDYLAKPELSPEEFSRLPPMLKELYIPDPSGVYTKQNVGGGRLRRRRMTRHKRRRTAPKRKTRSRR